jgi:hypothetical protein
MRLAPFSDPALTLGRRLRTFRCRIGGKRGAGISSNLPAPAGGITKTVLFSPSGKETMLPSSPPLRTARESRPLSYWNVDTNNWAIASGDYQVYVGASSRDIRLTGSFQVRYAEKE